MVVLVVMTRTGGTDTVNYDTGVTDTGTDYTGKDISKFQCQYGTVSIFVLKTEEDDAHISWLRHSCFAHVTCK